MSWGTKCIKNIQFDGFKRYDNQNYNYIYRLFNKHFDCIYIGQTSRPWIRIRQHMDKEWGNEISFYSYETHHEYEDILIIEKELIEEIEPVYNILNNPRYKTITLNINTIEYNTFKSMAEDCGLSLNDWIFRAMHNLMLETDGD